VTVEQKPQPQQRQNVQKENKVIQINNAFMADIQIKLDSGRN